MHNSDARIIKRIKAVLDVKGKAYKEQLEKSKEDFYEYCMPGSVNNWQHPQKPPTQASLALVANEINPERILDFGTGLTAYTFLKHTKSSVLSIDNSFVWLLRLRTWLKNKNLSTSGLTFFESADQGHVYNLENDIHPATKSVGMSGFLYHTPLNLDKETFSWDSMIYEEPSHIQSITNWKSVYSDSQWAEMPEREKLDQCRTARFLGYVRDNGVYCLDASGYDSKSISEIGKFSFIQFDFGHMWSRLAYLQCAISMLDRSKPSVINIDDLHKKDVFFDNKTYLDMATDAISSAGGVWLHCEDATTDFQGGYSDFAYFPSRRKEKKGTE